MIKNYLLTGIRSLRKHFSYSTINIAGLGLGLATCLLLVTWIRHELSYDQFHTDAANLYRANLEMSFGGQVHKIAVTPNKLFPALKQNSPEVENGARMYNPSSYNPFIVQNEDKLFQENRFCFADSTFFRIFSFKLVRGNPDKVLRKPYSVVLTESTAKKYFGDDDPVGKTLKVNNNTDYAISGVVEDPPTNSSIQFDFVASFHSNRYGRDEPQWFPANFQTFVKITPQGNLHAVSEKINNQVKTELASELTGENDYIKFGFVPIADIHLKEDGSATYIYIFSAIAMLILVIACINYINLSTARASDRAKEVGIRKVIGAVRQQLFGQFIGESVLITFLAFITALIIVQGMLPLFNDITGKNFTPQQFFDPQFISISIIILLAIAILSGAYPAFAITAFKPVSILKGNFKSSSTGIWLRRFLVVTQFTISIVLILSTLIIYKQLHYVQNKQLGYDKQNTIIIPLDEKTEEVYHQLRTELLRSGTVSMVARASESPTEIKGGYGLSVEGSSNSRDLLVTAITTDEYFIPAFGFGLKVGRNFTEGDFQKVKADTSRQSSSFIVNETTLAELSIDPDRAIGTRLKLSGRKGEIVGVVKDFHYASLHKPIEPLVIFNEEEQFNYIFIKFNPGDTRQALDEVKKTCHSIIPHRPFDYEFVDSQYASLYASEEQTGTIFIGFACLAIIIASLGLLGLISFAALQKTKEIGIRKVLGATASGIVLLITKDFIRLIVIAIVVGLPIAWWLMTQWLSSFAYKTEIGWEPIIISSSLCLFIAFATASFQALRAAWIDPAKTLRSE